LDIIKFLKNKILPDSKHNETVLVEEKESSSSTALIIKPDILPVDILNLLWFLDGKLQNYAPENKNKNKIELEGFTIEISFYGATEPSAISMKDSIQKPNDPTIVENPNYYPAYNSITPKQRWIYLNWLKNIEAPINIGYVFIFYYGLERHLFFGNYSAAFDMVLKLRQFHKNGSFLFYSSNALIASCILHNRSDLFINFLNNSPIQEINISDLYLSAKSLLNLNLTTIELMNLAKNVGFNNNRYLKDEEELFEQELKQLMFENFNNDSFPIKNFLLNTQFKDTEIIAANYSLEHNQRTVEIPSIIQNQEFSLLAKDLLQQAHNRVKEKLKIIRKNRVTTPAKPKQNLATKSPSDAYKKSILFEEINTHQFDKNIQMYNQGICPYCDNKVIKIPVTKGKCSTCKNTILVKNNEFTGEKIFLTEPEYLKMKEIQKERARRNWINGIIRDNNLDSNKIAKKIKSKSLSIEEELINQLLSLSKNYFNSKDYGLYRNCLMNIGNVYERINQKKESLDYYLIVCWLDLNGASNSGLGFSKDFAFTAPALIKWVNNLSEELNIKKTELKNIFIKNAEANIIKGMPITSEKAWTIFSKEIEVS
jgi:DNA-binding protein YbaB